MWPAPSPGSPDGGRTTRRRRASSAPRRGRGLPTTWRKRISLEFDEIIKLEKASEKVIVSPPQLEAPEVKTSGRRVLVTLADSLKPNTTYTVDFGDAIVDNNEGNPLGNFTYTFSTGPDIDSMQVAGTVLQADNLEPVKGMLVGLHRNLADSAFHTLPFDRVTHTDSRGRFRLYGVAPGKYRIFALKDGDQNFRFNSPTEMVAFSDSLVVPSCLPDTRRDTVMARLAAHRYHREGGLYALPAGQRPATGFQGALHAPLSGQDGARPPESFLVLLHGAG